jgi:magnesium transporter
MELRNEKEKILREIQHSRKKTELIKSLPQNEQGFAILSLSKNSRKKILSELSDSEVLGLAHYLDPDDATDLLQNLDLERKKEIIGRLNEDLKKKVEFLLRFNPSTAAGIMNLDYILVDANSTLGEALKLLQEHEKRTGKAPTILAVDNGRLSGELPGYAFALNSPSSKIRELARRVPHIKYSAKEPEISRCFKRHKHNKVAVTDDDGSIMGVIYSDDILRLMKSESEADLYGFAGVNQGEHMLDSPISKFKNRSGWLAISLFALFCVAFVVSLFEKTLESYIILAIYLPVIAGVGGNAGTQTLAVIVRGLSLNEIDPKVGRKIIANEFATGLLNGLFIGAMIALVAVFWNKSPLFGALAGVSMIINLAIASLIGAIAPMALKKLGKDPAISSTVFITALIDVCGFFIFLGLATLILM